MIVSLVRRGLAALSLVALPGLAVAQAVIMVRADSAKRFVAPSTILGIPVVLDLSAGAGTNVGSVTVNVGFAALRLTFDSVRTSGFGTLTSNTANAATGFVTFGVSAAGGTTSSQTLATLWFTSTTAAGGTSLAFTPSATTSASGADVSGFLRVRSLDVCVGPGGVWGDVNGDQIVSPLGDGVVNIIDAQQLARSSIALSVANPPGVVARGDVTDDGAVNIIDAQQIARYSIGLTSAARINRAASPPPSVATVTLSTATAQTMIARATLRLSATARDGGSNDVTPCSTVAWTSTNPAVATVSADGLVTAVAGGSTTISATARGLTASVVVTVSTTNFTALTAGGFYSCGVTSTAAAYCWGINNRGQLGDGTTITRDIAVAVQGVPAFASLSTGENHTCGLAPGGVAWCWGRNEQGQVGDGSTSDRLTPVAVTGGIAFTAITVGWNHTCGLNAASAAYCWARNDAGQLGDSLFVQRLGPVAVRGGLTFAELAVGWYHTCGRSSTGMAHCWGRNDQGQLGTGNATLGNNYPTPRLVLGGVALASIVAGWYHTCGLTGAGAAFCWGENNNGELGEGTGIPRATAPVPVAGGIVFTSLTAGESYTCGLSNVGAAYCWGRNSFGQLGDGTMTTRATPALVLGGIVFSTIDAGWKHTCARTSAGAAYCWGQHGGLGNGTSDFTRLTAVAVIPP